MKRCLGGLFSAKNPIAQVEAWLQPREAFDRLSDQTLLRARANARRRCDQADAAATAIVDKWLKINEMDPAVANDDLWTNKRIVKARSRAASAAYFEEKRTFEETEAMLVKAFVSKLEKGTLLAEGVDQRTNKLQQIPKELWRGTKLDEAQLFEGNMQDLAGIRFSKIVIGRRK